MSGSLLLDTCFLVGLHKADPATLQYSSEKQLSLSQCDYILINRLELLSF